MSLYMVANHHTGSVGNGAPSLQEMVLAKKAELEARLRALDTLDVERLLAEREQTAVRLAELDEKIAQVRAQLGLEAAAADQRGSSPVAGDGRGRMSSREVRRRIIRTLGEEKSGLSQLQIAERSAIAYGTVAAYLKANAANFRITGQLKNKRYFLK